MPWPTNIPTDIKLRLDRVLELRGASSAELWTEFVEWAQEHGIEAPELPEQDRPSRAVGKYD